MQRNGNVPEQGKAPWDGRWVHAVLLLGILALAWQLRTHRLAGESLWLDEWFTYHYLSDPFVPAIKMMTAQSPAIPPVYSVLAWCWANTVGSSVIAVRMLSVVIGLAAIGFVYLAGRELGGPRGGLVAALLLALSRFHVYYSQEIRSYGLLMLAAAAAIYCFLRMLRDPHRRWAVAHGICALFLAGAHPFGILLIPAEAAVFLPNPRKWLREAALWSLSWAPACVALAGWVVVVSYTNAGQKMDWLAPPTVEVAMGTLLSQWGATFFAMANPEYSIPLAWRKELILALFALSIGVPIVAWRRDRATQRTKKDQSKPSWHALLLPAVLTIAPVLLLYWASCLWRPCLIERYAGVAYLGPPLLLSAIWQQWPRPLRSSILTILLLVLSYSWGNLERPFRVDWDGIREPLDQLMARDIEGMLACGPAFQPEYDLNWRYPSKRAHYIVYRSYKEACEEGLRRIENGDAFWVLSNVYWHTNDSRLWPLVDAGKTRMRIWHFPGLQPIWIYRFMPPEEAGAIP